MKKELPILVLMLFCLIFSASPAGALLAGTASDKINPPDGTYLGGYDHNRKSTGIHDDLRARAVVFDDGKTAMALVVLDALSIQNFITAEIQKKAAEKAGDPRLSPENIIVQVTHTHCAPDLTGLYGASPAESGLSMEYVSFLSETASALVAKAWTGRREASLSWAETTCAGWVANDSEPGNLDSRVTILKADGTEGGTLFTLTNFPAHPTVLDGDNTLVSADWVGGFYAGMSEKSPGEHVYLQGAIGAWIQPVTPERTFTLAEKYGRDLAEKVLEAIRHTTPVKGTEVRVKSKQFRMPLQNETFSQMTELKLTPRVMGGGAVETSVAWFSVGEAQFATHPGETAPIYAAQTRELMKTGPKFVLGLGMDHLGYIVPVDYFDHTGNYKYADYLVSMSPGREAGPSMMKALGEIIPH